MRHQPKTATRRRAALLGFRHIRADGFVVLPGCTCEVVERVLADGDRAWMITARTLEHEYTIHMRMEDPAQLETFVMGLSAPEAINDRHVFQTVIREVYYPEEIQRLVGLPFIQVARSTLLSAPEVSPFVVGHEYGLLNRPDLGSEVMSRDLEINHERRVEFEKLIRKGRWKPPVPDGDDYASRFGR